MGILADANLNAFKDDKFWRNLHLLVLLVTLGGLGCLSLMPAEWVIGAQMAIIFTVWGVKFVLPKKEGKDEGTEQSANR